MGHAHLLSILTTTVASNNGYAYRHTFIRDAHDGVTHATRVLHDEATEFNRRYVAPPPTPLTQVGREVRDAYVSLKRGIRDAYVSIKREVEDLFN